MLFTPQLYVICLEKRDDGTNTQHSILKCFRFLILIKNKRFKMLTHLNAGRTHCICHVLHAKQQHFKTCWLPWLALLQGSAVWSLTCGWCVCSKLYLGFLDRFSEAFLLDCKIFARTKNNLWKISLMLYYRDCFLDFNVDFWRSRHVTHTNTCRQVLFHSVLSVLFRPQPLGCTRLNLAQSKRMWLFEHSVKL